MRCQGKFIFELENNHKFLIKASCWSGRGDLAQLPAVGINTLQVSRADIDESLVAEARELGLRLLIDLGVEEYLAYKVEGQRRHAERWLRDLHAFMRRWRTEPAFLGLLLGNV